MELSVERRRGSGRPKKKWSNGLECDTRAAGVCVNDVGDRVKWRLRTKGGRPRIAGNIRRGERRNEKSGVTIGEKSYLL